MNSDFIVKDNLTFEDFEAYVNIVADSYFETDEEGNVEYIPSSSRVALYLGFIKYCTEYLDISPDEFKDALNNNILLDKYYEARKEKSYINEVSEMAKEMADFKKAKMLHESSSVTQALLDNLRKENELLQAQIELQVATQKFTEEQEKQMIYANKINEILTPEEQIELAKKMANQDIDINQMADTVVQKYINSELHTAGLNEVIDSKNAEIKELKKKKTTTTKVKNTTKTDENKIIPLKKE